MDRKDEKHMQELYAAWGTTREEHMARMMSLVEILNARVAEEEMAEEEDSESRATALMEMTIRKRAAFRKKTAAMRRFLFCRPGMMKRRKKDQMASVGKPVMVRTGDETLVSIQADKEITVRDVKTKLQKKKKRRR